MLIYKLLFAVLGLAFHTKSQSLLDGNKFYFQHTGQRQQHQQLDKASILEVSASGTSLSLPLPLLKRMMPLLPFTSHCAPHIRSVASAHGAAAGMMLRDSGRIMLQVRTIAAVLFATLESLIFILIACTITLPQLMMMFMVMNMALMLMLMVTDIVALGAALLHCGCVYGGRGRRE
jgi:hypothetical protein